MTVSKKQQASVNKYVRENYDRILVTMPKGKKEGIKASADRAGQTVNSYINQAIEERQEREGSNVNPD